MGFPVELFVDQPVDEEFICSICHDVLQNPAMIDADCEHLFCKTCITDWKTKSLSNTCPLDRNPFQNLRPAPKVFISLLNKLKLHCEVKKAGCVEILTVEGILDHKNKCKHNQANYVSCPGGCGAKFWKGEQADHKCLEYMKNKSQELANENAALKEKCAVLQAAEDKLRKLNIQATASSSGKPADLIYAVCICEQSGGALLDLKLGDIVAIEEQHVGWVTYKAIKSGKKGLVSGFCVRILTYNELIAGFDVLKCSTSVTNPSPMLLSFDVADVIQIICKDARFFHPEKKCMIDDVWLASLPGRVGYVEPSDLTSDAHTIK